MPQADKRELLGVDGLPVEEVEDRATQERQKAIDDLSRQRAWLGREFLTWLLWRSESGDRFLEIDGEDVTLVFVGPVVLQGLAGDATELRAKGHQSAYSAVVKEAIARGLPVHQARLRLQHGEQVYEATVEAEGLSMRSVKLPALLVEEGDDRRFERLALVDHAAAIIDGLWEAFAEARSGPDWLALEVPGMGGWLELGKDRD